MGWQYLAEGVEIPRIGLYLLIALAAAMILIMLIAVAHRVIGRGVVSSIFGTADYRAELSEDQIRVINKLVNEISPSLGEFDYRTLMQRLGDDPAFDNTIYLKFRQLRSNGNLSVERMRRELETDA